VAASNDQIYKLLAEFNGKLGELTGTLKAVDDKVGDIRDDMSTSETASAAYRAGIRDEIGKIVLRQTHLEADVSSIAQRVEEMQAVTVEVTTLRTKAQGAGTAGRWLIRIGISIVGAAGWLVGVYTYLTGRPPP